MTNKLSVFLLLTILVNITTGQISKDPVTTNSSPSQDINKDTTIVAENLNEDNIVEGSAITEDEDSITSESPPEMQTSTVNENQYESNVDDVSNTETPTMSTESIIETTTNEIECVCDCFANGNQVAVSCSTRSPEETQNETTENSLNNDSTLPSAKTTTPVPIEENSTDSKNLETTSQSNVEANASTQSTVDYPQTTIVTPRPICTKPGVRAHELDCKQYYDCSLEESEDGNLHLITKTCPSKQAFNIELNRCSRDVSSCPLDIQCLVKGTVADPIGNSSYYLCEPRLGALGSFHIFHINCGSHEIYYPAFGKCFIDINDVPAFNWNEIKDIDIVKAELKLIKQQYKLKLKEEKDRKKAEKKLQKEAKKKAKQEAAGFACIEEGNFASQIGDTFYINCVVKKDKFKAYAMQCGLGEIFDPEERVTILLEKLATRSIEPSFGLLFGDLLRDLDVGTTGAAVIISTLDVCMNFSGLFVGPLLKEFSYRKVAIAGSLLCGLGLACTSSASSMAHIISTYGVINGIGVGLATSAAFVALNHYFKYKRGQAVGLSMAGTAIGMLIMPQLVRVLLENFSFRGAVLLLAGVALNAMVGSVLLQPAKWHMKDEKVDEEMMVIAATAPPEFKVIQEDGAEEDALPEMNTLLFNKHNHQKQQMRKNFSEMNMDTMVGSRLGLPKRPTFPRIMSLAGVQTAANGYASNSDVNMTLRNRKQSVTSNLSYMDFTGSILQVHMNVGDDEFEQNDRELKRVSTATGGFGTTHCDSFIKMKPMELDKTNDIPADKTAEKKPGFWTRFADLMDVDLLKDKLFLNILFGLSIFYVAEMNFKMVTPFFFANLGYSKSDVAFCLSITAITDIAARIVLPPIFDRTNIKKRTVFLVSIIFVAITRSIMAEQTEWNQLMLWLSICGFFRGSALSNFTLTVSEYCSLEKLPSAFGWHLVGKAVFVICFGPLIGLIRDVTNSYPICIHAQSFCIALCCVAWSIEYFIEFLQLKKTKKEIANAAAVNDNNTPEINCKQ